VHFLDGTLKPGYLQSDEVTLGHEVAGTIDQLGDGVSDLKVGDRVLVIAGERNDKNQVTTLGFDYDSGYAEYVIAKSSLVVKIPDNLPFEEAAIIPDAVSTPWAAISSTAKIQPGESVAVFGVGGLGIHAIQLLKLIGCSKVIAIDPRPEARAKAIAVGADFAVLYMRTQVLGHYGSEPEHTRQLVDFAAAGRLRLTESVTEVLPLEEAATALARLEKKIGNPIRIVLRP